MSDVHGKKREKTTEELLQAKKQREAVKIKEYNELVEKCRNNMDNKDYSEETFKLTTQILQWNPDYYTIWNYRRTILLEQTLAHLDVEEQQKVYGEELMLFLQLIKINPKSYWLWNHRIWCLQHMPKPDWLTELGLVEKMLTLDARNFHGWDYRRFVVSHLQKNAASKEELAKIIQGEYEFTTKKINQSFSNYSAWHRRSKLLPDIVETMSAEERNTVATNELDLVKNAIYTDPEDQSAWLYYWWLLGKAPENVSLLGAYRLEGTSLIVVGFNDIIKFTKLPELVDGANNKVSSRLYPVCSEDGESSSIWVLSPSINDTPVRVNVSSTNILPSCSSRLVPQNETWSVEIKQITRDSLEGVKSLEQKISTNEISEWKDSGAKMYKDPTLNDPTAWFSLDKVQLLNDEIETVRELLEVEPDSAWALQTLVHFLDQLQLRTKAEGSTAIFDEILKVLEKLVEIDSDRKYRYIDRQNYFLFKKLTQVLLVNDDKYEEDISESLDLGQLGEIPIMSILLLVSRITVSSEALQTKLRECLPFLNDCKSR